MGWFGSRECGHGAFSPYPIINDPSAGTSFTQGHFVLRSDPELSAPPMSYYFGR